MLVTYLFPATSTQRYVHFVLVGYLGNGLQRIATFNSTVTPVAPSHALTPIGVFVGALVGCLFGTMIVVVSSVIYFRRRRIRRGLGRGVAGQVANPGSPTAGTVAGCSVLPSTGPATATARGSEHVLVASEAQRQWPTSGHIMIQPQYSGWRPGDPHQQPQQSSEAIGPQHTFMYVPAAPTVGSEALQRYDDGAQSASLAAPGPPLSVTVPPFYQPGYNQWHWQLGPGARVNLPAPQSVLAEGQAVLPQSTSGSSSGYQSGLHPNVHVDVDLDADSPADGATTDAPMIFDPLRGSGDEESRSE